MAALAEQHHADDEQDEEAEHLVLAVLLEKHRDVIGGDEHEHARSEDRHRQHRAEAAPPVPRRYDLPMPTPTPPLLLAITLALAGAADAPTPFATREIRLTAGGHEYDARLSVPDASSGVGVVLVGGGMGNDLDWVVPGTLEINGETVPVTISGEPHADAPRLARVFAERGAAVLHWSTIARDDPLRDRWPLEMTPVSMEDLVKQTQAAIEAVRALPGVDRDRIVLAAHSLGGHRATAIAAADPGIAGLVLIGAARLTRTSADDRGRNAHRSASGAQVASLDADGSGAVERSEAAGTMAAGFDRLDFDGDGVLHAWEVSAGMAREARRGIDLAGTVADPAGELPWGEDVLVRRRIPTLILYGSLDDAQAHHAPIIAERLAGAGAAHATVVVLPGLGHTMGRERGGRIGPFDDEALRAVGAWFDRQFGKP